jgi:hypothetical protein
MPGHLNIAEIEQGFEKAANELNDYCSALSGQQFFNQPPEKWSVAQQVKHLTTATRAATLPFTLPKFMVKWATGKPNRHSRTYDELVTKYRSKLQQGGRASGRFVPEQISATYGKDKMLQQYLKAMQKMSAAVKKKWTETQTDQYLAPHPLLGKITLRELCYFTIYHTWHHLESIRKLTAD